MPDETPTFLAVNVSFRLALEFRSRNKQNVVRYLLGVTESSNYTKIGLALLRVLF